MIAPVNPQTDTHERRRCDLGALQCRECRDDFLRDHTIGEVLRAVAPSCDEQPRRLGPSTPSTPDPCICSGCRLGHLILVRKLLPK